MKRLFSLSLAALLAVSALGVSALDSPASAAGPCTMQSTVDQVFIYKHAGDVPGDTNFDGVRGEATIRQLDVCVGLVAGNGLTAVLPANVENANAATNKIFQLGYVHRPMAGLSYVMADGQGDDLVFKQWDWCPIVIGHRVRFTITRTSSGTPWFYIEDLTAACGAGFGSPDGETFGLGMEVTWWGYERNDTSSGLGVENGDPNVNMAYMGYRVKGGAWTYRSGLTNSIQNVGGPCKDCIQIQMRNPDTHHFLATIGDWVYNNDLFNVRTDY